MEKTTYTGVAAHKGVLFIMLQVLKTTKVKSCMDNMEVIIAVVFLAQCCKDWSCKHCLVGPIFGTIVSVRNETQSNLTNSSPKFVNSGQSAINTRCTHLDLSSKLKPGVVQINIKVAVSRPIVRLIEQHCIIPMSCNNCSSNWPSDYKVTILYCNPGKIHKTAQVYDVVGGYVSIHQY